MAAYVELELEQYASFSTSINVEDGQGDFINLSGYSVSSQIRKSPYSVTFYSFNTEIGDEANGEIIISMHPEVSANINPGKYMYDTIITTGNNTTRVIEGIVEILPGITRL
jgi:hypothetical protein